MSGGLLEGLFPLPFVTETLSCLSGLPLNMLHCDFLLFSLYCSCLFATISSAEAIARSSYRRMADRQVAGETRNSKNFWASVLKWP